MKTEDLMKVLKICKDEEAVCKDCPLGDDEIGCISIVMTAAEEEIMRLQSEKAEIEKRLTEATGHLNDLAEEISRLNGVIALKPKWIPVTERLPENVGYYIVWDKYAKVPYTLWYHDSYDREFADGLPQRYFGNASNQAKYTHWMPLPDAPEEETNV